VQLGMGLRVSLERTFKQAGSVPSSAIGSALGSMYRCPSEHTWRCTWEHTWSVLGSILRAYLEA